jgi:sec-independent protein translocase protein TatC
MWKWMFSKVVKMREKVALDLGDEDAEKPFLEHLEDLRVMLIRMATTLAVTVVLTFAFYHYLWAVITYPIHLAGLDGKIKFFSLTPMGGFMALMNLSIAAGIVLSSPLQLYYLLQFILPGLRNTEKKVLFPALAVGAGLFLGGACFAYFVVAPKALYFFYEFNKGIGHIAGMTGEGEDVTMWGIAEYSKFICQFVLLFGLCFELPVVVMALVKLDILSYKVMKGSRSWAAIGIVVVSAIIAPSPDPQTLLLIAGPLYLLYEICIWLAWWLDKRDRALYPEYYKEQEEDQKAIEASDEWDNESYNPWGDDSSDEEELPAPRPAPAGTRAIGSEPAATPAEGATTPQVTPEESHPSTPEESSSSGAPSSPETEHPSPESAEPKPAEPSTPAPEAKIEESKPIDPVPPSSSAPEAPKPADPDHPNPPPGHPHF